MDDRTTMPPIDEQQVNFESAATAAPLPEAPEENPLEQVLRKPIDAHGEKLDVLHWREPTGGDIEFAGNPLVVDFVDNAPRISFNERKMGAMISHLAQVPPSSVKQLTAADWTAIAFKLIRFFSPGGLG